MKTWSVLLIPEAKSDLDEAPPQVRKKFDHWVVLVEMHGPWQKGGWRTEALHGNLKGFYSIRLNRQWRAIFELKGNRSVIVVRIIAHDYRSIRRR